MENRRYLNLDLLKVFASLSVIAIHIAATKFYVLDVKTFDWEILNFVYSISRYCVPVFVMITGVVLLDENRDTSLKVMITKYLFKIIVIYIIWSTIYAIVSLIIGNIHYGMKDLLIQFIYRFIAGPTHFSYLFTISGLYLITPFIKKIVVNDKSLLESFLVISIVFSIIKSLNWTFQSDTIIMLFYRTNIDFFMGYTFYFVGGYYLLKYPVSKPLKRFIYIMGIIGLLLTIFLTSYQSRLLNSPTENYYGYLEFSVILSSFFMFQLFLDMRLFFEKYLSLNVQKTVTYLSKINLSVYIIHPLFIVIFSYFGLLDIEMPIVLYLIIFIPLTYILSVLAHYIYSKIISFIH